MATYTAGSVRLEVIPDMSRFGAKLRAEAGMTKMPPIKIGAEVDKAALGRLRGDLDKAVAKPVKLPIDTSAVEADIKKVQEKLTALRNTKTDPKIGADIDVVKASMQQVEARLEDLRKKPTTPKVDADIAAATAKLGQLQVKLDGLEAKRNNPKVDVDIASAESNLKVLEAKLHDLRNPKVDVEVDADRNGSVRKLATDLLKVGAGAMAGAAAMRLLGSSSDQIEAAGSSAAGAAGKVALIGAAAGAAGAAVAVLPGLIAGAAGAVGVLALSLKGVGDALTGYEADQDAAGKAAATAAKSTTASARAIRSANEQVTAARKDAARTAEQGASQIAAAERRVSDAVQDEARAQEDVTRARKAASLAAEDLRSRVSHLALDQEEATIRVQEAEAAYALIQNTAGATERDKAKALLDLKQARLDQSDLTRDAARAEEELNNINKNGIDSTDGVQAALRRQGDAAQNTKDARAALSATEREAALANQDASARITEALRGVAEAQQDAAQSSAAAAAGSSQFADAMSKLSPPAQELVRQLLAMKPLLDQLSATAAQAFLPGLTQMLKDSTSLFPIFNGFLRDVGQIMGQTARDFGQLFKSSEFQANLQATMDAALPLVQAFGDALVVLTDAWFQLGAASGPATQGLADFIGLISGGLADFLVALQPAMQAFGDIWRSLGVVLGSLLSALGPVIAALANALGPVLAALTPAITLLVNILGSTLTGVLIALTPVIVKLAEIVAQVALQFGAVLMQAIEALLPLVPPLADAVLRVLDALMPLIPIVAAFAAQVIEELLPFLPELVDVFVKLIDDAVVPLIPPLLDIIKLILPDFIQLIKWLAPLVIWLATELTDELAWGVNNVVIPALKWLAEHWVSLGDTWTWVWEHIIKPVVGFFEDRIRGFKDTFGRLTDGIGQKWAELKQMFKEPINWVIRTVWNGGVGGLWEGARKILPALPAFSPAREFATGGSVYGPGTGTSDSIPAMLSNGEHVWTAREVEKAGGHQVVEMMRRAALMGGQLPRFAAGGAVYQQQMMELHKRFPGLPMISGPRPGAITATGNQSMHSTGRAVDVPPRRDVFDWIKQTYGSNIYELIFSPMNGAQVYRGQNHMYGEPTRGDHWDHVHWSMQSLNGVGGGISGFVQDAFNWFTDQAQKLIDGAKGGVQKLLGPNNGGVTAIPHAAVDQLFGAASSLIMGKAGEADAESGGGGAGGSGGAERWRGLVLQALGMLGQPASLVDSVLRRMNQESGGNPRAINNWDSNAKRGTPSKGLMQVIDPTFRANRDGRAPNDIWDPLANVLASMRYAKSRYGSLGAAYNRKGGYDSGGWLPPGATLAVNNSGVPEAILTGRQWDSIQVLAAQGATGGDGATINVYPRESQDETAIARNVMRIHNFAGRAG